MIRRTSTTLRRYGRLVAFCALLCFSSCGGIQNAINPAGPYAGSINRLWWWFFITCSIVYVLVMIALLLALRNRTRETELATPVLEPPLESERRRRNVVIGAVTLTVVILFVLLVVNYLTGRSLTAEQGNKSGLNVDVVGHQWWWEVRYKDVDASNVFTTANEIHIPVGVPVLFNLQATDVIHSFWVPNLAGKKDLIPGKINGIWLQADKPGVYRGQCAEYCGMQHAKMAFWVVAESQEQFNAWRQNQTQTSVQPMTDSQKRGQQVFLSSTCVMCHAINGTPAGSNIGPNLTHVASRQMIAAATLANTRDHLAQWIKDPQVVKPGTRMPQNNLPEADLQALLDYLQSLK
ncbi:MAG TPA: cytochrome c oxidase subunit II [Pyrinomonadaceae bacterium]